MRRHREGRELFLALVLIGHDSQLQAHDESLPNHIHYFLSLLVHVVVSVFMYSCSCVYARMHTVSLERLADVTVMTVLSSTSCGSFPDGKCLLQGVSM